MLPKTHLVACDRFKSQLDTLQMYLKQPRPNPTMIVLQTESLENCFRQEILALSDQVLEAELAHQWRVRQIEMNRLLRLLKTDLMFWQLAIKAGKIPKQSQRIQEHLQKLKDFCGTIPITDHQ